jgi:ABC-type amino acid transport substrate-binding protein
MKTKPVALTLLLAGLVLCSPVPAEDGLTDAARLWLDEHRELRFAGQAAYPPFEFIDGQTGEYTGMAVELIRWIATEYGFTAIFEPMPFQAAQTAVLQGTADALSGLFKSDERALRYDFSTPIFSVSTSLFTRSENSDLRSVADLNGKRVAVQRGDYAIEYLSRADADVEFVYADDFRSALRLVSTGKADALIGDEETVLYYIYKERLGEKIRRASGVLYIGQDCMAVVKGEAMLLAVLDAGIEKALTTGTLDTIYRKWTGLQRTDEADQASPEPGLALIAMALALALLAIAVSAWRIRVTVRSATATLTTTVAELSRQNEVLASANARLHRDLEERSRLEEDKRRIDAETAARRVEELTRCAIAAALDSTSGKTEQ